MKKRSLFASGGSGGSLRNIRGGDGATWGRAEIEAFLRKVAARPNESNGHVQQARNALELYYERFRGIALACRPNVPVAHVDALPPTQTNNHSTQVHEAPPQISLVKEQYGDSESIVKHVDAKDVRPQCQWGDSRHKVGSTEGNHAVGSVLHRPFPAVTEATPVDRFPSSNDRIPTQKAVLQGNNPKPDPISARSVPSISAATQVDWRALQAKVIECLRLEHYSYRTEQTYVGWIRRFVFFHGRRRPSQLGPESVKAFLKHLAMEEQVSASTQNQALNAVVFLYKKVIRKDIGNAGYPFDASTPNR